jgi:deoxyribodipyrimidine photo-lyase
MLKEGEAGRGPVLYWMSRDQRVDDNWALIFAQELALERQVPLGVVFCLAPEFLNATFRQYGFMLKGLAGVEKKLARLNVPFMLLQGEAGRTIGAFAGMCGAGAVITDFDPLRAKREWKQSVCGVVDIPVYEVDAHNIVPCWEASPKQEYGAFSFRPKIRRVLDEYLEDFPVVKRHPFSWDKYPAPPDWRQIEGSLKVDRNVPEVVWLIPGESEARRALDDFLDTRISIYPARNDPNRHAQSDLSPYLHFGQLSAQKAALEVMKAAIPKEAGESFLEELIVRRELSDNFCYYNERYDSCAGFPDWVRKTLDKHRDDPKEYIYGFSALEEGKSHDGIWNAAQMEMVTRGKMAGYMRMYWAKKILEWTPTPEAAMEEAIYLNDRYELDGRDPNGYAGIAWAIGGVHDRPWRERRVFGSVRFMSEKGLRSKFDVNAYVNEVRRDAGSGRGNRPEAGKRALREEGNGYEG